MKQKLRIAAAQLDFLVGDISGNTQKIIKYSNKARDELNADIVVFPELAITGYPPEDLLLRSDFYKDVAAALKTLQDSIKGIYVIFGYPEKTTKDRFNAAMVLHNGKIIANYRKQKLPNYGVFDEKRYFVSDTKPCVINLFGVKIALSICEDLWFPGPMSKAAKNGAQLMISINASPFDMYKPSIREQVMSDRAKEGGMPLIYVNCVGGQDELVFAGGTMVLNRTGEVVQHTDFFTEELIPIDFQLTPEIKPLEHKSLIIPPVEERIYKALVMGVRDYIKKNHFPGAVIGLSGGIDSALTLAIAVDAIGAEKVETISMPSRYTRDMSVEDAEKQAKTQGVGFSIIPIEEMFEATLSSLAPEFEGLKPDVTEENIQARCRGILLMAVSNKKGSIVLSTGNKSEMSVGYSTLYGDMVGGFCVLKDVPKTMVYRLAEYRNKISPVIPERVITRAPSAELAEDQLDQNSLPDYPVLDGILELYIEHDKSVAEIVAAGFDEKIVKKIVTMVIRNEYKRRQAPPGVRITARAFGRDRRYPITSGFTVK